MDLNRFLAQWAWLQFLCFLSNWSHLLSINSWFFLWINPGFWSRFGLCFLLMPSQNFSSDFHIFFEEWGIIFFSRFLWEFWIIPNNLCLAFTKDWRLVLHTWSIPWFLVLSIWSNHGIFHRELLIQPFPFSKVT